MKYRRLPRFDSDYKKLSAEERQAFRKALGSFIAACREHEESPEAYIWPKKLRVERLTGNGVMAMTWSLAGPDGRGTFQFVNLEGETYVVWRRVGRHAIYREP